MGTVAILTGTYSLLIFIVGIFFIFLESFIVIGYPHTKRNIRNDSLHVAAPVMPAVLTGCRGVQSHRPETCSSSGYAHCFSLV